MVFTFPTYITVRASSREQAENIIKSMMSYEKILVDGMSYVIGQPIADPTAKTRLQEGDHASSSGSEN